MNSQMVVGKNLKTGEIVAQEYGRQILGQQKFDPETGEILEENVPHGRIEVPGSSSRIVKAVVDRGSGNGESRS